LLCKHENQVRTVTGKLESRNQIEITITETRKKPNCR